jgi:peptide-methionine (R)-S-oxide reductase
MSTESRESASVLKWAGVIELARRGNVEPPRRVEKTEAEWRAQLTDE